MSFSNYQSIFFANLEKHQLLYIYKHQSYNLCLEVYRYVVESLFNLEISHCRLTISIALLSRICSLEKNSNSEISQEYVKYQTREQVQSWGEHARPFPVPSTEDEDADAILSEVGDKRLTEFKGGLYGPDISAHCCSAMSHSLHIG